MSKDEALKLALEALESADWYIDQLEMIVYCVDDDGTHESRAKMQAAITAIKEALAQPAQQRPWVGLTDEEISSTSPGYIVRRTYALAIERALREKNT